MELKLNTSQKLTMSQQMVLSAKILQMSSAELNEYIKELSQSNPLVEYEEPHPHQDEAGSLGRKLEWLESGDEQNRLYYSDDREYESENRNFATSADTYEEHLLAQIRTQKLKPEIEQAAEFAVKSLDENGYLTEDAQSISALTGINKEDTLKAIELLHTLDPPGSGAADLKQCLLLQLDPSEGSFATAKKIVENHLDDLARNRLKAIASSLGVALDEVVEASRLIKSLNPKPSRGFPSSEGPGYIMPDACICRMSSGEYEAILSDYYSASLKINGYYKGIIKSGENPDAAEYISEKLRQAQWVLKCIDRRNSTLLNTIRLITELQKPFFDKGVSGLIPMTLSDVASRLGIHESTVSRAVRDKYIQCSWGIFPLGYFFSSSVSKNHETSDAAEVSRDTVKLRIREMISAEDKKRPLSDRAIAEALEAEGISISRRTVAKYRESMDIAGTSMRKDF